jgi:ketosteroid isomerase-like protein
VSERTGAAWSQLDDATAQRLARAWQDGWNRGDLDTILAPFATDVVFSSPGIAMMTGDPARTTIAGAAALRDYLAAALERTRDLRYTLRATYAGVDSVVLVYDCGRPGGPVKAGADLMRVGGDAKIVEWRCHF